MTDCDLIVAGAGPVGTALACAMAPWLRCIALVDPRDPRRLDQDDDPRTLALARTSARILGGLGLWRDCVGHATAIRQVEICGGGGSGHATLEADATGLDVLGYAVDAQKLDQSLRRGLEGRRSIRASRPGRVAQVATDANGVTVTVATASGDKQLRGRLLVAADGDFSTVRRLLNIPLTERDYGHSALVTRLKTDPPPSATAYEYLTEGGPLALLPGPVRWSAIWAQPQDRVETLMGLDDVGFARRLQRELGPALNVTSVGPRTAYPLRLIRAHRITAQRVVLLGNAAHTVHPVAAQGLNLGLRDMAHLAERLVSAVRRGADIGASNLLDDYEHQRRADQSRVVNVTDTLARLLADESAPGRATRAGGLLALNHARLLQRLLVRFGTGGLGPQPRLLRGLPL